MESEFDALLKRRINNQLLQLEARELPLFSAKVIMAVALVHYGLRLKEVCALLGSASVFVVSVQMGRHKKYLRTKRKNRVYREYVALCSEVTEQFKFIQENKVAKEKAVINAVSLALGVRHDEVLKVNSRSAPGVKCMISMLLFEQGFRYEDIRLLIGYSKTSAVGNSIKRHTATMIKGFKYPEYVRIFDHSKRLLSVNN